MDDSNEKKIVELVLDNQDFEQKAKQSTKTIQSLDSKLGMEKASKGLDTLKVKFSSLNVIGIAALSNLTVRAMNLGTTLVKSLSIGNVMSGWTKFGEKTMSVATMASQTIRIAGKEITDYAEKLVAINKQLDKLNWFTDETSYNFTDMVDSISKFTAAGVDLDKAVEAMMGIANWAALSGQNATMASRAMYQLAQAMSKGYIEWIDYKSIQNVNMDTQDFRQTVLDTAVALKMLTKEGENYITKTGKKFTKNQFKEALNEKWFSSEVLTESLRKYSAAIEKIYELTQETGLTASEVMKRYSSDLDEFGLKAFKAAQEARTFTDALNSIKDAVSTGWLNTFENIFGGYEQSKELWTDLANSLYDVFAEGGNFRNDVLALWKDLGGRSNLFEHGTDDQGAFWNIYDAVTLLNKLIKSSISSIFNFTSFAGANDQAKDFANQMLRLTSSLKLYSQNLLSSISNSSRLKGVFTSITNIGKILIQVFQGVLIVLNPLFYLFKTVFLNAIDRLISFFTNLEKLQKISAAIERVAVKLNKIFSDFIDTLNVSSILNNFIDYLIELKNTFFGSDVIDGLLNSFEKFFDSLKNNGGTLENIQKIFNGFLAIASLLAKTLIGLSKLVVQYIYPVMNVILTVALQILGALSGIIISFFAFIGDIFVYINNLFENDTGVSSFSEKLTTFIDSIFASAKKLQPILKSIFSIIGSIVSLIMEIPKFINKISISLTGRGIVENLQFIFEKIAEFIDHVKDLMKDYKGSQNKKGIFSAIATLAEGVASVISGTIHLITPLITLLGKLLKILGNILEGLATVLETFADGLKTGDSKIVAIGATIGIILVGLGMIAIAIYNFAWLVRSLLRPFRMLAEAITDVMDRASISWVIQSITNLLYGLSVFFLSLAASVAALSSISTDKMETVAPLLIGVIALISIVAIVLVILSKTMINSSKFALSKAKGLSIAKKSMSTAINEVSKFLTSFAVFLIAFAYAMKKISSIDSDELIASASVIGIMMAAISIVLIVLALSQKNIKAGSKDITNAGKNFKYIGKTFLSFALSLRVMIMTLEAISKIPSDRIWESIKVLVAIMAAITVFFLILKQPDLSFTDSTGTLKTVWKTINSMSFMLISIAISFLIISQIKIEDIRKAVSSIGIILAIIAIVLRHMNSRDLDVKVSQNKLEGTAKFLKAISILLISMAASLLILSSLDENNLWRSVFVLTILLGVITGVLLLLNKQKFDLAGVEKGFKSSVKTFFSIVGLIILLTISIKILAEIEPKPLFSATGAVIALFVALGIMTEIIGNIKINKQQTQRNISIMVALVLSTLLLIHTLKVLAEIPEVALRTSLGTMLGLILAVVGSLYVISKVKLTKRQFEKNLAMLIAMVGSILVLSVSLKLLSAIPFWTLMGSAFAISTLILAISGTLLIISKIKIKKEQVLHTLSLLAGTIAAIMLLTLSLKILSSIPFGTLMGSVLGITLFISGVVASLFIISKIKIKKDQILRTLGLIAGVIAAILVLTLSLKILSTISFGTLMGSVLSMSLMLVAVVGSLFLISKIKIEKEKVLSTLLILAGMIAAILLLTVSLKMLSTIPINSLIASTVAISVLMTVLFTLLAIFGGSGASTGGAIGIAVAITILAFALLLLASALIKYESISLASIGKAMLVLVGGMAALGVGAFLLAPVIPIILALALAVTLIGMGMLMAAVAMQVFAVALTNLGPAMQNGIEPISQALESIGPALVTGIINSFKVLLVGLVDLIPLFVDVVATLIYAILDFLQNDIPKIVTQIIDVIVKILQTVAKNIKKIVTALVDLIVGFLKGLIANNNIGKIVTVLVDLLINLIDALVPNLLKLATKLFQVLIILVGFVLELLINNLGVFARYFLALVGGVILILVHTFIGLTRVLYEAFRTIFWNIIYVMNSVLMTLGPMLARGLKSGMYAFLAGLFDMIAELIGDFFGLGDMLKAWANDMRNAANSALDQNALSGQNVLDEITAAGNRIKGTVSAITTILNDITKDGVNDINNTLVNGMNNLSNTVNRSATRVGRSATDGVEDGIQEGSDNVYDAAKDVGETAVEGAQDGLDSHSPSLKMMKLGEYAVEGLSLGLNRKKDLVYNSITRITDTLNSIIEEGIDTTPVIKPVVDLSDTKAGIKSALALVNNLNSQSTTGRLAYDNNILLEKNKAGLKQLTEKTSQTSINNEGDTYYATFNITSTNAEDIVDSIDAALQQKYRMTKIAKGGV